MVPGEDVSLTAAANTVDPLAKMLVGFAVTAAVVTSVVTVTVAVPLEAPNTLATPP